jgi:ADP-heptose:LPS heptosyltransferase
LLPPTDLEGLAAAMSAAKLVLTSDSGPLHLAVALQVPTVAVFLKEGASRWTRPSPTLAVVEVRDLPPQDAVARIVAGGMSLMAKAGDPVRAVEPL